MSQEWRDAQKEQPDTPGLYPVVCHNPGEWLEGHQLYPPSTYESLFRVNDTEVLDGVRAVYGQGYYGGETWSDVLYWLPALPPIPQQGA